ncbi:MULTISPECIES: hypothetical protein [Phaeobacter]|uniref:hypothetical protein n=1 Tax=Phaeobacter TaxID=302485 RepID=UPI000BDF3DD3|nr:MULTISPECIES: hypothetical protein [Phaeobacter]
MKYLLIVAITSSVENTPPVIVIEDFDSRVECETAAGLVANTITEPFSGSQKISCQPLQKQMG